jgi:hypothetical protein
MDKLDNNYDNKLIMFEEELDVLSNQFNMLKNYLEFKFGKKLKK